MGCGHSQSREDVEGVGRELGGSLGDRGLESPHDNQLGRLRILRVSPSVGWEVHPKRQGLWR